MKKFGILTLYYKNDNYGGIAQGLALQSYIESRGYDAELISYKKTSPPFLVREKFKSAPFKYLRGRTYNFHKKLAQRAANRLAAKKHPGLAPRLEERKAAFEKSREKIKHSPVFTDETIAESVSRYDCFISGSDQIWKPGVIRPAYVCAFLPEGKPCFSYASSIAVKELSGEYADFMRAQLKKYSRVSVREESAKKNLEKITGREISVVSDPTLLLSREEWQSAASDREVEGEYMLVYLLGQSKRQRSLIKELAERLGLKIVFFPHVEGRVRACDLGFGDICLYDVDLADFLGLISRAGFVCTDSFHAVVFSILFQREFIALNREVLGYNGSMGSRLKTLLSAAGLEGRLAGGGKALALPPEIDYRAVSARLEPVIAESKRWLNAALAEV